VQSPEFKPPKKKKKKERKKRNKCSLSNDCDGKMNPKNLS
jgi:hypothetical protein